MIQIEFKSLYNNVQPPIYATKGSAGFDLTAEKFLTSYDIMGAFPNTPIKYEYPASEVILNPGSRILIGCGFSLAIPEGYEMQIRPRSGLALKYGLTVLNSPGTIDADYRGEIGVILINQGSDPITIKLGDKIAQGVIKEVELANFVVVEELSKTDRGEGGFGSTDNKIQQ